MDNIGKVLKEIREQKKLSQVQVAKRLRISQGQVSRVESGLYATERETIDKFAKLYGVPSAVLMWKAMEEKDVQKNKVAAFKKLKPAVDNIIAEFFK